MEQVTILLGRRFANGKKTRWYIGVLALLLALVPSPGAAQTCPRPASAEPGGPPVHGRQIQVPAGTSWQDLEAAYGVRADVLFEINGCRPQPGGTAFIPGDRGAPSQEYRAGVPVAPAVNNYTGLSQVPLPPGFAIGLAYGWRPGLAGAERQFHSGVDLLAAPGTPVVAAEAGSVVFAGQQDNYGNLVVVNHPSGWQTRYAHLATLAVTVGETVAAGRPLGTVGTTGRPDLAEPHLHFEVRSPSPIGWVAQDPTLHLELAAPSREFWDRSW